MLGSGDGALAARLDRIWPVHMLAKFSTPLHTSIGWLRYLKHRQNSYDGKQHKLMVLYLIVSATFVRI